MNTSPESGKPGKCLSTQPFCVSPVRGLQQSEPSWTLGHMRESKRFKAPPKLLGSLLLTCLLLISFPSASGQTSVSLAWLSGPSLSAQWVSCQAPAGLPPASTHFSLPTVSDDPLLQVVPPDMQAGQAYFYVSISPTPSLRLSGLSLSGCGSLLSQGTLSSRRVQPGLSGPPLCPQHAADRRRNLHKC